MEFIDRHGNTKIKPDDREVLDRHSVYGLLVKGDHVLLFKELELDYWELPGGGVDEGEDSIAALVRELQEETGITVQPIDDVPFFETKSYFYADYSDKYYISYRKVYRVDASEVVVDTSMLTDEDMGSFGLFHIDELKNLVIQDFSKSAMKQAGVA